VNGVIENIPRGVNGMWNGYMNPPPTVCASTLTPTTISDAALLGGLRETLGDVTKRVLELNADHPAVTALRETLEMRGHRDGCRGEERVALHWKDWEAKYGNSPYGEASHAV
jgi:hypothetical protein